MFELIANKNEISFRFNQFKIILFSKTEKTGIFSFIAKCYLDDFEHFSYLSGKLNRSHFICHIFVNQQKDFPIPVKIATHSSFEKVKIKVGNVTFYLSINQKRINVDKIETVDYYGIKEIRFNTFYQQLLKYFSFEKEIETEWQNYLNNHPVAKRIENFLKKSEKKEKIIQFNDDIPFGNFTSEKQLNFSF